MNIISLKIFQRPKAHHRIVPLFLWFLLCRSSSSLPTLSAAISTSSFHMLTWWAQFDIAILWFFILKSMQLTFNWKKDTQDSHQSSPSLACLLPLQSYPPNFQIWPQTSIPSHFLWLTPHVPVAFQWALITLCLDSCLLSSFRRSYPCFTYFLHSTWTCWPLALWNC